MDRKAAIVGNLFNKNDTFLSINIDNPRLGEDVSFSTSYYQLYIGRLDDIQTFKTCMSLTRNNSRLEIDYKFRLPPKSIGKWWTESYSVQFTENQNCISLRRHFPSIMSEWDFFHWIQRNIFEISWNQTEIRLYLSTVSTIWFRFDCNASGRLMPLGMMGNRLNSPPWNPPRYCSSDLWGGRRFRGPHN